MIQMLSLLALLTAPVVPPAAIPVHSGRATWYDCKTPGQCSRSKITASGQRFDPNCLCMAHPWLRLGTRVLVVGPGGSVEVVVNDRGPRRAGWAGDLTPAAAEAIGMRHGYTRAGRAYGQASVTLYVLSGS